MRAAAEYETTGYVPLLFSFFLSLMPFPKNCWITVPVPLKKLHIIIQVT